MLLYCLPNTETQKSHLFTQMIIACRLHPQASCLISSQLLFTLQTQWMGFSFGLLLQGVVVVCAFSWMKIRAVILSIQGTQKHH